MKKIIFNHEATTLFGSLGIDEKDNGELTTSISEWVGKYYFDEIDRGNELDGQFIISRVIEKILNHWENDQAYQVIAISFLYRGIANYLEPVEFYRPTMI